MKMEYNPWNVEDTSMFLKYCCPECDFQVKQLYDLNIISNIVDVFLLEKHKKLVLKTLYNKGGEGVEKVSQSNIKIAVKCFNSLINYYSVPVVIQEFLEDVKLGDKRVILLEGSPVGVINRIPTKGEFKANLHLGGQAKRTSLTKKEKKNM